MRKATSFATILLAISMVCFLSACGKISKAQPIEGSGYPHEYPRR